MVKMEGTGLFLLHFISVLEEHPGDLWIKKNIFSGQWSPKSLGNDFLWFSRWILYPDVENLRLHQILFTKRN